MTTRLTCAAKTDVGLKRTNNEDNLVMVPSHGLYVLADGMGGHASGQVASTMCVTHVAQFMCETCHQPGFEFSYKPDPKLSYEANLLVNAIKYANERIFIQSCKDRSMEGMGTTITAILNAPHGLVLAHVGDSRIYRIRKGQIVQMSRDHSLMNHLLDTGELKPEDAPNFANKNIILRAVGLKDYVDVEVKEVPREQGDIYLMCSDGLSDIVSESQILQAITNAPNLTEACNTLINLALQAGGKDNVTVVCVCIEQDDGVQQQPASQQLRTQPALSTPPSSPRHPNAYTKQTPTAPTGPSVASSPGGISPVSSSAAGVRSLQQPTTHSRAPGQSMGMSHASLSSSTSHSGMAPIPTGRPAPINASQPVPPAMPPSKPQRMHSVREIVEQAPVVQRTMPKPIGSAGRSNSATMPQAPGIGKIKPLRPETEHPKGHASQSGSAEEMLESQPAVKEARSSNIKPTSSPTIQKLREAKPLAAEEKAARPEASLLFTEPPSEAPKPSMLSVELTEPDDDEEEPTMILRDGAARTLPSIKTIPADILPPDALHPSEAGIAKPPFQTRSAPVPGIAPVPANSRSSEIPPSPAGIPEYYRLSPPPSASPREASHPKGYVAPKEAIAPPENEYDDEDSIEIGGGMFDHDDGEMTRQFQRPPHLKW
ncbi:MAG: Stp1/IreP family PP2C-type Ser/Thr phosphatase [Proteobacteria bacterium]|nr:Stp1/IreP family PP2C-type Ser/Thr phosphatase [Pseudomonadota bacterium]